MVATAGLLCLFRPKRVTAHDTDPQMCSNGLQLRSKASPPIRVHGASVLVRLTRRLAEHVNGVDLSDHAVGDVMDLSPRDAAMMVAEGWAAAVPGSAPGTAQTDPRPTTAAEARRAARRR